MFKWENLPEGWKIEEFDKLFEFEKKSKKKAGDGKTEGKYKFFTSSTLQSKYIDNYQYGVESLVFGTGGNANIHYCNEKFSCTADCFVTTSKTSEINVKFVYYFFLSNMHILEHGFRGISIKHLSKKYLGKVMVVYPHDIRKQEKIVEILERVEKLKEWRAEADDLNDEFLKSVFLEMFGDPAINPKKWNVIKLKNVYSKNKPGTKCGPFGSALKKHEYTDSGIPVWIMDNIKGNEFIETGCLYITPEKFNELESYSVEEGDIIISRAGTVGKMCIVSPSTHDSIISTNLIRLSLDQSKVQPIYFISLMTYFKGRVGNLKTGQDGSYTFMNTKVLNDLKIPLPPIELQDQFVEIVKQVKTLKICQKQSKHQIDTLFNALMQKAFKGELTC